MTQTEFSPICDNGNIHSDKLNGPYQKFSRGEEENELCAEVSMIKDTKIICSLELLEGLFKQQCAISGCISPVTVSTQIVWVTALITYKCSSGHKGKFCTSHKVKGLYANNIQVSAAILLSGNNQDKVGRMFDFSSMPVIHRDMFIRYQKALFCPAITEWWEWMRRQIVEELADGQVILAGGGQCDSPGKCAKYLSYYLMDSVSNYIAHIEIFEKRMVGGKSCNKEVQTLKK